MYPAEQTREHERYDRHQLDQDVNGGPARVFQRVADGIAYDSSLVNVSTLACSAAVRIDEIATFDVLLSVVPSTSGIGCRDGKLDA